MVPLNDEDVLAQAGGVMKMTRRNGCGIASRVMLIIYVVLYRFAVHVYFSLPRVLSQCCFLAIVRDIVCLQLN